MLSIFDRAYLKICRIINTYQTKNRSRLISRQFKSVGKEPRIGKDFVGHGLENVTIGENFICGERCKIRTFSSWGEISTYTPIIEIGDNCNLETDCNITCINKIVIGNNVLIASRVFIGDNSHGEISIDHLKKSPLDRPLFSKGPVVIGDNVWIGEGVAVMPNVTIGESAVIGSNSVVTHDIPPHSVAAGNPAKVIKTML